jgi:hypothetical protein
MWWSKDHDAGVAQAALRDQAVEVFPQRAKRKPQHRSEVNGAL